MHSLRLLLLGLLAVLSGNAAAFSDGESLARWVSFYYQSPEPQRLREAVTAFLAEPARLAQPERLDAPVHFFAVVARSDAQARRDLSALAHAVLTVTEKQFIERVLRHPGRLEFSRARDPNDLDVAWSHFSATGSLDMPRLVLAALDYKDADVDLARPLWRAIQVKDRPEAARLMRGAAAWSLSKHAQAHPRVREYLEKELVRATAEPKRQQIRGILDGKISLR